MPNNLLFPSEVLRTRDGRFATEAQVISERNAEAAAYWRREAETYKRQADVLAASVVRLEHQLDEIKRTLKSITL